MSKTAEQQALTYINQIAADFSLGRSTGKRRNQLLTYKVPYGWIGKKPVFGYTPWKSKDRDTGTEGFYALKYAKKGQNWVLVKKVRFGKRKTASQRAWKWHQDYYENPERLELQKIKREKHLETLRKNPPKIPTAKETIEKKIAQAKRMIERHKGGIRRKLLSIKNKKKLIRKWKKREKYYKRRLREFA